MEIYRHTLDELITRYVLEPTLCDIYVEGLTDKCLLEWFLDKCQQTNYAIYDIDTVDIPTELLFSQNLVDNKRSRVIFFALHVEQYIQDCKSVVCIADKDFYFILDDECFNCNLLLFTDYTSLDMYFFNKPVLDKLLRLTLGIPCNDLLAIDVIKNLSEALENLFLIRATNQVLKFNMEWLAFERCCKLKGSKIDFSVEDFIERYLHKNQRHGEKTTFLNKLGELQSNQVLDTRRKIRGKDFISLLCWYIKPYITKSKSGFCDPEVIKGSLMGCIDLDSLLQEDLFKQLLLRVKASLGN